MLRELPGTRQIEGEPPRRWFFCQEIDLVVWFDEVTSEIFAFQLAYNKQKGERSVSWHKEKGYQHYVVDDGEPYPGADRTPILKVDGAFKRNQVLKQFIALSNALPSEVVKLVTEKLKGFSMPRASTHIPKRGAPKPAP